MATTAKNKKALKKRTFQQSDNKMLIAALGYAERLSFAVIPLHTIIDGKCTCFNGYNCQSKGKHPRISKWQEVATTDRDTIIQYWQKWPDSNIGIVTGKKSGFFVLDVDIKRGKDGFVISNGFESLDQLTDHSGALPDTSQQISGSREGNHYLFKYKTGIGNKTDLMPGIDIKGDDGFIVVAPSIHESGNNYEWELSSHPLEVSILDAPQWLLDMVIAPKGEEYKKKPSNHWMDVFNNTSEGNRNNNTASLVGHMLRRYIDPFLVREIIYLWNSEKVSPPLEISELDIIINSIANKEMLRRGGTKREPN